VSAGDAGPAGDAGQAQGQGEAAEGQQQQAGPDYAAIMETLQQQGQGLDQMREFLQTNPWQAQEQEAEPEQQLPELGFLESGDPEFDQQLAQNLQNLISQQAEQQVQQHLSPLQEQLQTMQREKAASDLVGEFPELNEPEHAQRIVSMTRQYAEMMGRPDLADEPQMWRLMHLANAAMVAAKEEGEQSPAAHLEGAGGAGAGQQPQVDLGDMIVNGTGEGAPLGRRALPFQ
jgi:uncharacterized protein YdiU (UPF0061 family)